MLRPRPGSAAAHSACFRPVPAGPGWRGGGGRRIRRGVSPARVQGDGRHHDGRRPRLRPRGRPRLPPRWIPRPGRRVRTGNPARPRFRQRAFPERRHGLPVRHGRSFRHAGRLSFPRVQHGVPHPLAPSALLRNGDLRPFFRPGSFERLQVPAPFPERVPGRYKRMGTEFRHRSRIVAPSEERFVHSEFLHVRCPEGNEPVSRAVRHPFRRLGLPERRQLLRQKRPSRCRPNHSRASGTGRPLRVCRLGKQRIFLRGGTPFRRRFPHSPARRHSAPPRSRPRACVGRRTGRRRLLGRDGAGRPGGTRRRGGRLPPPDAGLRRDRRNRAAEAEETRFVSTA